MLREEDLIATIFLRVSGPGFFFRRDISVICTIVVLKLAVTPFISLYFWPNWLKFFRSFK